jgi:flagellar protein FlgJ
MTADSRIAGFNDFNGLAELKLRAGHNDPKAVKEAARQFEALFLQMMLKSMRDAGAAFAEERDRSYEEMFDQQVAIDLAQKDSIGIADLLLRQIDMHDTNATPKVAQPDSAGIGMSQVTTALSSRRREDFNPQTANEFVRQVWPLARKAGEELGVDPRAIVAQAALETGWGQNQIRDGRGVSSNNLFGIKAGDDWSGDRVTVRTLEYEDTGFTPRHEQFRAYATLEEGFEGYVDLLRNSPRYRSALERGEDATAFAVELKAAGYATDPRYAHKINDILSGERLERYIGESLPGG